MIRMVIQICRIDERPIEQSNAYKLIRFCCGKTIADQLTYEVVIPHASVRSD